MNFVMRRGGVLLLLSLLAACSTSGRPGLATKYRPMNIFGGYSEKLIEPGLWKVSGGSNGMAEVGFGRDVAAYRAAEIIKAAGFSHMQIVDQRGATRTVSVGGGGGRPAGENLDLWVRGTNDPAAPLDCRAKNAASCATIDVADLMMRLRPRLALPPEGAAPPLP